MPKKRVRDYLRKDGTRVRGYYRKQPKSGERRGVAPDATVSAAAALASTEIDETHESALNLQAHASYPSEAARITKPLAESGIAVAHGRSNLVKPNDVLRMLNDAPEGFTYPPDGSRHTPQTGYAVTIQGTDYQFSEKEIVDWQALDDSISTFSTDDSTSNKPQRNDLRLWLVSVRPLLDTGYAWIGGWHASD